MCRNQNQGVSPDVGGGFGMKANLLSRRHPGAVGGQTLRPAGEMDRDAQRKPALRQPRPRSGRLRRALRSTKTASSSPSGRPPIRRSAPIGGAPATAPLFWSLMFIPSLYDVQTIDISTNAVFTNTAPTSVYRGAGRPEAIYLIERLVERAAQVTGIDRVELRRRNLIKPEALPYTRRRITPTTAANSRS
jgi:carbon-monoxide dehydrogenase large subunit